MMDKMMDLKMNEKKGNWKIEREYVNDSKFFQLGEAWLENNNN